MPLVIAFDTGGGAYHARPRAEKPDSRTAARDARSFAPLLHAGEPHLFARTAEPAFAAGKDLEGVEQVVGGEVGPEDLGEIELGVRRLDEEKIAEALLAP